MTWLPVEGSSTLEYNSTPNPGHRNTIAFQAQKDGKRQNANKTVFYQIRKKK
jgi:hypothetical protein